MFLTTRGLYESNQSPAPVKKVKQSHYRPGGFQEVEASRFQDNSAHDSGKVVSPAHRQPLPHGSIPGTHFC